jgi:hypothetical protein
MQTDSSDMDITSPAYHDLIERKLLEPRTYWTPVNGWVIEPNGGWQTFEEHTRRGRRRENFRRLGESLRLNKNESQRLW